MYHNTAPRKPPLNNPHTSLTPPPPCPHHSYKYGLGQSPFPVPKVMVEALRESAHEKDYLAVQGLPALREAVAQWLSRVHPRQEWDGTDV